MIVVLSLFFSYQCYIWLEGVPDGAKWAIFSLSSTSQCTNYSSKSDNYITNYYLVLLFSSKIYVLYLKNSVVVFT